MTAPWFSLATEPSPPRDEAEALVQPAGTRRAQGPYLALGLGLLSCYLLATRNLVEATDDVDGSPP